jgi:alginate O-acetyltransferase complex protein AlgI
MTSAICPVCSRRSCFYNLASLHLLPVMIQHLVPRSRFEQALGSAEPYLYGLLAALMYVEAGPETSFVYF